MPRILLFIKLIAAMDRRRGWDERGYCNLGNSLDYRCGLGPCAARERIRIGRALARLPRIDAAFRDGILSYSKVRAITRVATRETEAMLLSIAQRSSAAQLESLVRTYQRVDRSDGERLRSEERRGLSWHYEDGMLVVINAMSRRIISSTGSTAARPGWTTWCCCAAHITGCCTTASSTSQWKTTRSCSSVATAR